MEIKRLPKQNYTLEFKQEAIRRVEVEGNRQAEVAREQGIIEQPSVDVATLAATSPAVGAPLHSIAVAARASHLPDPAKTPGRALYLSWTRFSGRAS